MLKNFDAERYLSSLAKSGVRPSLERITEALNAFGRPDRQYGVVLVTGTNGKGTCAKALAEILRAHGWRVGLYTSPHLFSYTERYEIDGKKLSKQTFQFEIAEQNRMLQKLDLRLTEFEFLTLLAYRLFAKHNVRMAVVEVGMGGKWDATNAADPRLSILTGVGIDHTEFLGLTEKAIAFDKAHVARKNKHLLIGRVSDAVREVVLQVTSKIGARADFITDHEDAWDRWYCSLPPELFGNNISLAILAARKLLGEKVGKDKIQKGIRRSALPGRFQEIAFRKRRILFDVAHNGQALEALFGTVRHRFHPQHIQVILGMQKQKKGEEKILPFLRPEDRIRLVHLKTPRSKPLSMWRPLVAEAKMGNIAVYPPNSMETVLTKAIQAAGPDDLLVVTGSFHTVREGVSLCV